MSITVSTCNEICNAPTNLSTAKMLYTFPKQPRFLKKSTILCDKFYDLKNTISGRATTFGYGYKSDFTKDSPQAPPPNTYNLDQKYKSFSHKGIAFGQSRQRMVVTGPLFATITNKNPGPGNYETPSTRSKISFSLSSKIDHPNKEQISVPGPGQYCPPSSITKDGKYFLAKYKNSGVGNFGKKAGRCTSAMNLVPGPGSYDTSTNQDLSPKGRYALSKTSNCASRSFTRSSRGDIYHNCKNPGPGSYKLPSQFGYYASKKEVGGHEQHKGNKENYIQ